MEIMYQGYQHYPLSVYQNRAFSAGFKAFTRMHEPIQGVSYRRTGSLPKLPASQLSINKMTPTKAAKEPRRHKNARENSYNDSSDGEEIGLPEAEYLPNLGSGIPSILYTYYTDINKVIDGHFTRALNGPSSFVPIENRGDNTSMWKPIENEQSPLMIQRNLPPSFWRPSVYSASQNSAFFGSDPSPYFSYTHHVRQPDPWHYSSYAAHTNHRRQMELAYTSSAFSPHYNSLLIQPPVRHPGKLSAAIGGESEITKTSDSWRNYSEYNTGQHEYAYPSFITETSTSIANSSLENQVASYTSHSSPSWF